MAGGRVDKVNSDPRLGRVLRTAALLGLLAVSLPVFARNIAQKKQAAETLFEKAEQQRQALTSQAAAERTRRDYLRVIDSYRRVYFIAPTSPKADPSVLAVAQLLAEMGRSLKDQKASRNAITQYEFLRREYPGSKHRADALFTIAQIYRDDLGDTEQAKSTCQEFLKRYPHSQLAGLVRSALEEMDKPKPLTSEKNQVVAEAPEETDKAGELPKSAVETSAQDGAHRGHLLLVTGIRHWSTPDYTRVAIDLEQQVKYEAGRVPRPDRIFFDLHGTRLSPELVGKSFDVDDGFLHKIRVAQYQRGLTRVVLEVDDVAEYSAFLLPNPYRLIIDIHGRQGKKNTVRASEGPPEDNKVAAKPISKTGLANSVPRHMTEEDEHENNAPLAVSSKSPVSPQSGPAEVAKLEQPELKATTQPTTAPTYEAVTPRSPARKGRKQTRLEPAPSAHEAKPTSSGEQTLIRALGLKIGRIVVDAGHGGHDTGTIGPGGLEEKDLVLDVALRLGKLLETRMGADVTYTREDDTFVPLETRTAIANKAQADLFISIHANSSRDPSARGVETYYLNFTSSAAALEVAARENAVSDKSIHELQDLVKKIALKEKVDESREFAADVLHALQASPVARGTRDRGVKKAPFIVLIGANMPSVLAEISFLSNPQDAHKLSSPDYRQKIAEALYRGVAKYVSGLSGVKMATKLAKDSGQ